jgi:hypothetical protein
VVESIAEAEKIAFHDIEYVSDMEQYGHLEYWASPEETLSSMKGDCEDKALLFMRLVHDNFDEHPTLCTYTDPSWGGHGHITVRLNGIEYEYQGGTLQDEFSYEETMSAVGYTRDQNEEKRSKYERKFLCLCQTEWGAPHF